MTIIRYKSNLRKKALRLYHLGLVPGSGLDITVRPTLTAEPPELPLTQSITGSVATYDMTFTFTWTPLASVLSVFVDFEIVLTATAEYLTAGVFSDTTKKIELTTSDSAALDTRICNLILNPIPRNSAPVQVQSSQSGRLRLAVPNSGTYSITLDLTTPSSNGDYSVGAVTIQRARGLVIPI